MLKKLKISKKMLRELDYSIIIICLIIALFGALNIYSATHLKSGIAVFKSQLIWIVLGLIVTYIMIAVDYSLIENYADIIYWFGVVLLFLNDTIFKSTVNGAGSWLKIGSVTIGQPSELAKVGLILMIAKKVDQMEGNINNLKNLSILALYAGIPMILIVIQPDMGMTMVCFFIVLGMLFMAGLDLKIIAGGFSAIVLMIIGIWNSPLMQPHWKERLISFVNPEADELGIGHQVLQSKIGIGSGGFSGNTDFIFAVVGEEWGFIGGIFLLVLYGMLMYKFINIARTSKDIFGTMVCVGVTSMFLFSILQNMGMAIGLVPVSGITLPFMSYGGSALTTAFMSVALVLNVGMRRKKINF